MASVNKESLREEFGALKERFGRLCTDGKVSAESRALFEALLMLLQVLMAVFMEKNTPKNSTNSSKPASRSPKDDTALSRQGTHGKGKELTESRSANTRTVENFEVSPVSFCEECGEDLHKVPCDGYERRTQIDIVFEKVVTHVDAEIKPCPHCGTEARGSFPAAFCGPLQYGAGIKAYALNLLIAQMISLKRVQQSLQTLLGQVISEATILKYVLVLHLALEQWEKTAIEKLLILPALLLTLPASLQGTVVRVLPGNAGQAIFTTGQDSSTLSPWAGLAVFALYAAAALVLALVILRRRDA